MDIDLTKPLYIFILDLSGPGKSRSLPKSLLRRCSMTSDVAIVTPAGKPVPVVRGSTPAFGSWSKNGRPAVPVTTDQYGILVNDFLPSYTQYKWVDLKASGMHGDIDPDTGYCHEPDAFVDRSINCVSEPKPGEEIVIVVDRWGECGSDVTKTSLEEWILNTEEIDEDDDVDVNTSNTEITESYTTSTVDNSHRAVNADTTSTTFSSNQDNIGNVTTVTSVTTCHYTSSRKKDEDKDEDTSANQDEPLDLKENKDEENNEISEMIIKTETIREVHSTTTSSAPINTKDDIDNNNMTMKKTDWTENKTSNLIDNDSGVISEMASKRMLRISESDTPEIDQVLKVIVCEEISTLTIDPETLSPKKAK